MCVYECTKKPFDGCVETLVKYEVHRYMITNEWINAAMFSKILTFIMPFRRIKKYLTFQDSI